MLSDAGTLFAQSVHRMLFDGSGWAAVDAAAARKMIVDKKRILQWKR